MTEENKNPKLVWAEVDGKLHAQFKEVLRAKSKKRRVRLIGKVELGRVLDRHMRREIEKND
jgi:hypothetical protein